MFDPQNPYEFLNPYADEEAAFDFKADKEREFKYQSHQPFHTRLSPAVSKRLFILTGIALTKVLQTYLLLEAYEEGIDVSYL